MANGTSSLPSTTAGGRAVSKPEWGTKRQCQSCGTKFYDMRRPLITCPSCGAKVDRESPLKSRRGRASAPKPVPVAAVKPPSPAASDNDEDTVDEPKDAKLGDTDLADDLSDQADKADGDIIEDTSELGDDDISDVVASKDDDDER